MYFFFIEGESVMSVTPVPTVLLPQAPQHLPLWG